MNEDQTDARDQLLTACPDLVSVEDYEQAVRILMDVGSPFEWQHERGEWVRWKLRDDEIVRKPGVIGRQWLARAAEAIAQKVDRSFRDGPKLTTEQHAMAYVKGLAPHFLDASKALLKAAETLKAAGKGLAANEAYLAHKRAAARAQELNP